MNRRQGVTLIELLVAGFIAAMVAYLAFDLIAGEHAHYTKTRTKVKLQSNGREAIRAIEEDLLNAGFRTGLTDSAHTIYYASLRKPCGTMTSDDRIRIRDGKGADSDTLDVQFFDRGQLGIFCPPVPTPNIIRYYTKNGALVREFTPAGSNAMISSTVLDSVVTLQFRLGLDSTASSRGASGVDDTLWMAAHQSGRWSSSSGSLQLAVVNGELEVTNWKQAVPASFTTSQTKTLQPLSTYVLSTEIKTNADFRLMYGASGTSFIRLRLLSGGTLVDSVTLALPPFDGSTRVAWRFQTGRTSVLAVAPEFDILLSDPLTAAPMLSLTRFQVTRVRNAGQNGGSASYVWADGDGSAWQSRSALAVQVWLLCKSMNANHEMDQPTFNGIGNWEPAGFTPGTNDHNSYLVYHRIVPVGNYGY